MANVVKFKSKKLADDIHTLELQISINEVLPRAMRDNEAIAEWKHRLVLMRKEIA
jgi:hypothetical protein